MGKWIDAKTIKDIGADEIASIGDNVSTIVSKDASLVDRGIAAVDLMTGLDIKAIEAAKRAKKGPITAKPKGSGATNRGTNGQTGFSGSRGNPLENPVFQPSRNTPAIIGDRAFTGHALDQMQNRGIPPSVVEDAISPSNLVGAGNRPGTNVYYSGTNGVRVITNSNGDVVTVITAPRQ